MGGSGRVEEVGDGREVTQGLDNEKKMKMKKKWARGMEKERRGETRDRKAKERTRGSQFEGREREGGVLDETRSLVRLLFRGAEEKNSHFQRSHHSSEVSSSNLLPWD